MYDSKEVELKSISVWSVFRFYGGVFLFIGLIMGLFGNLFRIDVTSGGVVRIFPFMAELGGSVLLDCLFGVLFGVFYGLAAGIAASIGALFYNFFAALTGGIKITLKG